MRNWEDLTTTEKQMVAFAICDTYINDFKGWCKTHWMNYTNIIESKELHSMIFNVKG